MEQRSDAVLTAGAARAAGGRSAELAALVAAVGLGDSMVIGTLHDHGVRAETVPVLEWLPAVDVCWLDGADVAERYALRVQYASDDRSTPEGVELLDRWLTTRPAVSLFAAGRRALRARLALIDPVDRGDVVDRIVAMCEAAGRAAGADFGVNALSATERDRIQQLRRDLEDAAA
jgi:hypothetical protein